ncbi:DinB family protein [Pseudomonas sp. SCB32]|uniref:DinB family protein n=1 Tax=Pseudomonas sp. SCB32 TaxID=2653853 RepID=UPI001C49A395|nr:DinB family protein [Pseudomonas sp. SCB32]
MKKLFNTSIALKQGLTSMSATSESQPESAATTRPAAPPTAATDSLKMLVRYKAWANELTFESVMNLPEGEALRPRQTRFGNMVHTLNHVYVVDDIFRHHLQDKKHHYTARNTEHPSPLGDLWSAVQAMDRWYIELVDTWSAKDLSKVVHFEFVGGGKGVMTQEEIVLHLVNHATYHRGFVGDMIYQIPVTPPSNDLPVFIRDHYRKAR